MRCLFLLALLLIYSSTVLSFVAPQRLASPRGFHSKFGPSVLSRHPRLDSRFSSLPSLPTDVSLSVSLDAADVAVKVVQGFVGSPLILLVPMGAAAVVARCEACEELHNCATCVCSGYLRLVCVAATCEGAPCGILPFEAVPNF